MKALDIEYVETLSKKKLIHSVAVVSSPDGIPVFMIAKLPRHTQLKDDQLLVPELRSSTTTMHHADVNTIRATVRSIADLSTIVMWDAEKDIAAIGLPPSVEESD